MPWTAQQFASRHNKGLDKPAAAKAARIANGMLRSGVPEGEAIATANARAEGKPKRNARSPGFRGRKTVRYTGA